MKRLVLITACVVALMFSTLSGQTAQRGGNCQTWFLDPTVTSLFHAGCKERPSGLFDAAPGRCAKVARQAYRKGLRDAAADQYARTRGCIFDGGSWENISFTI